jgi:5-(carboxyamino)imidazole ribonucleotide mutase
MQVGIVMGSDSDLKVMKESAKLLEKFGISYEINILSAHRATDATLEYARKAKEKGIEIIIAGAGKAAHLPGVMASATTLPVIGVPMKTSDLGGVDSLYSIVQMPTGIPVATVAIGKTGAKNSAILAVRILALKNIELATKLEKYMVDMKNDVLKKNDEVKKMKLDDM